MAVSPALFLTGWVSVYHETEMWAAALCIAAAAQTLRLWREPSRAALLWASGFALATLLTRATVGIGAFVAIAGVGLLVLRRDRRIAIGALAAAAIGALVHVGLNEAKFGTLFDLPADRQLLTLQSPARAAWFAGNGGSFFSLRFLPTTIVQYLRPDTIRLERLLPVVRYGPLAHVFGSYPLESNTASSSLTASATVLLVMAIVGVVVLIRRRLWGPLVVLGGMIVAAIPSFLIGFTANRYLVDMLPALAVPAAFAAVTWRSPARLWVRILFGVGVVWGAWVNLALATWTQQLKSPGFTAWRYQIDDALFGGSPPSVVRLGSTVPRDGVVGIDGQCAGLYIAEQGRWVALERSPARDRQRDVHARRRHHAAVRRCRHADALGGRRRRPGLLAARRRGARGRAGAGVGRRTRRGHRRRRPGGGRAPRHRRRSGRPRRRQPARPVDDAARTVVRHQGVDDADLRRSRRSPRSGPRAGDARGDAVPLGRLVPDVTSARR